MNGNFLLKNNKFSKILAEINAQITRNGLCSAQNLKIFQGEKSPSTPHRARLCVSERPDYHKRTQLRSCSNDGGHPSYTYIHTYIYIYIYTGDISSITREGKRILLRVTAANEGQNMISYRE